MKLRNQWKAFLVFLFAFLCNGCANDEITQSGLAIIKGEYDQAIMFSTKAIERNYQLDKAYANRGMAYLHKSMAYSNKGELNQAIADLNKSIELNPTLRETYVARCLAYKEAGEYQKAIADCTWVIESKPGFADALYNRDIAHAYINRGSAYTGMGDANKAIDDYNKALDRSKLDPNRTAMCYANRSVTWRKIGNLQEALKDADESIKADPKFFGGFLQRGLTQLQAGREFEAKQDFDQALKLQPDLAPRIEEWKRAIISDPGAIKK